MPTSVYQRECNKTVTKIKRGPWVEFINIKEETETKRPINQLYM